MREKFEISISEEDLRFIVKDRFEEIKKVALFTCYCANCKDGYKSEMVAYVLKLNPLNDVIFQGKCKACNGSVARYIEIGEDSKFSRRAELIKQQKLSRN